MRSWPWNSGCVLTCCLVLASCSKDRSPVVAEVEGVKITAGQFQERYTKYRELGSPRDNIILRRKILNNMVNEVLILQDCTRRGFDSDKQYKDRAEDFELQALLDAYARRISVDTVQVTEPELWREFRATNSRVNARYLYAKTEDDARALKARLERGETFESIAREVFEDPDLAANGGSLGLVGWGDLESEFEQVAFSLAPGQISDPVKIRIGYAIIKVEQRVEQPLASEIDYAKRKPKLDASIRERKMRALVKQTADVIAADLAPQFDERAVDRVLENWGYLEEKSAGNPEVLQIVPDTLASVPMVKFRGASWTVGEFIQKAEKTSPKQRNRVRTADDVKDVAIGLATREVLLERAREAGLESDEGVQNQIKRVREDYLLRRWGNAIWDTVGAGGWDEQALRKEFEENKQLYGVPPMVNVAEILVRSREQAATIVAQLRRGADFGTLARKHSVRRSSADRGGELGYGSKAGFAPLGDLFFGAKVGHIIGPETIKPYYGIFKILGRKEGRQKSFDEARDEVIQTVLPWRRKQAFESAVNGLRAQASVRINEDVLANVVIPSN